jgi:hypothetical protein
MRKITEKVTATLHRNGRDVWILSHEYNSNRLCAYIISEAGLAGPVFTAIGHPIMQPLFNGHGDGCIKVSPNGKLVAITNKYLTKGVAILDFDNEKGTFSNLRPINVEEYYGIEFSPDNSKLYMAYSNLPLVQYDIGSGKQTILRNMSGEFTAALQLGPDGRIYLANRQREYLGVINTPNNDGLDADLRIDGFHLGGRSSEYGLPFSGFYVFKSALTSNAPVCDGQSVCIQSNFFNMYQDIEYYWEGPENFRSNSPNPCINDAKPENSGYYKLTARYKGFTIIDSILVVVSQYPNVIISPSDNQKICQGETIVLSADNSLNHFRWSTGDTSNKIIVSKSGTYILQAENKYGCKGWDTVSVEVVPYPISEIEGSDKLCSGTSAALRSRFRDSSYSYIWSTGETGPEIIINTGGKYSLIVTNEGICTDTSEIIITDSEGIDVKILGDIELCQGFIGQLSSSVAGLGFEHTWSNGDKSETISISKPGIYWLMVEAENGCIGFDTVEVRYHDNPEAEILAHGGETIICPGVSTLITAYPNDITRYTYDWDNGSTNPERFIDTAGMYSVIIRSKYGCSDSAYLSIRNFPPVEVDIHGDTVICKGSNGQIRIDGDYQDYLWNTGETSNVITVNAEGNYKVTVTDINGCKATDSVIVKVVDAGFNTGDFEDYDFGYVCIGERRKKEFTISNYGSGVMRIIGCEIKSGMGQFNINTYPTIPALLAPSEKLVITVSYNPTDIVDYIDSLIVTLDEPCHYRAGFILSGKANPSVSIILPEIRHQANNEKLCIPIYAQLGWGSPVAIELSYSAELVFDAHAFEPSTPQEGYIINGLRRVPISGNNLFISSDGTKIGEVCGRMLLGEDSVYKMELFGFSWDRSDVCLKTSEGVFITSGVCVEDIRKIKLFHPLQIMVHPNPADDILSLTICGDRDISYNLCIYSSMGNLIRSMFIKPVEKEYEFRLDISNIAPGLYFIKSDNTLEIFIKN